MDYLSLIRDELARRQKANPAYSLRAFSRQLQMSPAQLSQILSEKRPLTVKAALRIAENLNLSPSETSLLVESTVSRSLKKSETTVEAQEVKEEEFQLIADWYHLAILSLSEVRNHKADPRWIAARLGISQLQANQALNRLLRLKIISIEKGKIVQIMKPLKTTTDIPSAAIRRYHTQNLELAKERLEITPVDEREYSSITMAISKKNLPKAKKMITQFKRKLCELLEEGEKQAVYSLALQLFPVTKPEKK